MKPRQRSDLRILEGQIGEGSFYAAAQLTGRVHERQWQRVYLAVLVAALGSALLWRLGALSGVNAAAAIAAPQLPGLLNGIGIGLWAAGWLAGTVFEQAIGRSGRQVVWPLLPLPAAAAQLPPHLGWLLACGSAPVAAVLAYAPETVLQRAMTADPAEFNILLGAFLAATVLAFGSPLLALSAALFAGLRASLGSGGGTLIWLAAGLCMNARLLGGAAGAELLGWTPLLPGQFASGVLAQFASDERNYTYLREMLFTAMRWPLLLAATAFVAALLAAWRLGGNTGGRPLAVLPAALPPLGGTAVALLVCAAQNWRYTIDPGLRHPGQWLDVFSCGFLAIVLLQWLIESTAPGSPVTRGLKLAEALRLGTATAALALLALPNVATGQLERAQLGMAAGLGLLMLLLSCGLVRRLAVRTGLGRGSAAAWCLSVLTVCLLCVPVDGRLTPLPLQLLSFLSEALVTPELAGQALTVTGAIAAAAAALAVPWQQLALRLRRRRRTGAAAAANL